ncbi:MAG TPA: hypothetical protein VN663_10775 [Ramlibacter sp.]|nr:hypothetical protein [Ramlibacter sp.]
MAYELNASNLLNPMMVWSDLGLRALDMTVSSSQNISESVDRLTRAGASLEPVQDAASSSAVSRQSDFAIPGVALSADLQRSALDLMMQGWMQGWTQWMSTLGTFASLAARGLGEGLKSRDDALGAMKAFLPISGPDTPARVSHSASGSRQHGSRRDARAESGSMEHAFASAEPKRRRAGSRAKAKSRRSRST